MNRDEIVTTLLDWAAWLVGGYIGGRIAESLIGAL